MRLLARGIAPEVVLRATEKLDRCCLALCEGQYADLGFQDRLLVTSAEYHDMISKKAGALTGFSAAGAALGARRGDSIQEALEEVGVKLGQARQISHDIADFWANGGTESPPATS